jgi:peptide/nickel transport system permease protein
MYKYMIRRVLLLVPAFIIITTIIFGMVRLMPGTIVDIRIGKIEAVGGGFRVSPEERQKIIGALGLDVPVYIQYLRWLADIVRGDFGFSLGRDLPVAEMVAQKVPVTLELALLALFIAILIAVPVGVYSSIRQDSIGDYIGRGIAVSFISLPSFWVGLLVVVLPSIWWGWSPPVEYPSLFQKPIENLTYMWIPAAVVGLFIQGAIMRTLRTTILDVMRQDYVRTAWSKGLKEGIVMFRHVLRNGLIPVVTVIGLQAPYLIGGTIVIERIFLIPGLGNMLVSGIFERDYTVISGASLFFTFFILIVNLLTDLSYAFLDPRVRYR